ncbi:stress transcription factor B-2b [Seminavis robusta]|uniref:Stress transcription factor B-2b n=1 Tax=Seminavis robusta TaxID=568900 RepID=A0A9N8E096_9STRA|nr:stress transcription factor B-2b [Seminavis robusta]|eukprot:Sro490_g153590.1 stress transcription factor B-2b (317) ;mRNA; r:53694-54881
MADKDTSATSDKEKLRTLMDAALGLGGEESESTEQLQEEQPAPKSSPETPQKKRYLPPTKRPDAAYTFPEKLMSLMRYAEDQADGFCIAWLPDGKSFVIRNPDEFTRHVVPKFFKATKFSSFTRKLYRWGFRQVNRGIGPDDPIIFGNEHFQRDNAEDMSKMRSITAASSRKAEAQTIYGGGKRPLEGPEGPNHKRALLDHLIQQKAVMMNTNPSMYAGLQAPGGAVSLTSALRPSLGLGVSHHHHHHQNHFQGGLPAMMSKHMDMMGQQNGNNLMNSYMPQHQNHAGNPAGQQYPSTTSTADIVNAAISALRYAS